MRLYLQSRMCMQHTCCIHAVKSPCTQSLCILHTAYCIQCAVSPRIRLASGLLSPCISTCTYVYMLICTCLHLPLPRYAANATTSCNNRGPYTPSCAAGPRRLKIRHSIFAKKITNFSPASSMCKCNAMQANAEQSAEQCRNNECRAWREWACRLDNPAW